MWKDYQGTQKQRQLHLQGIKKLQDQRPSSQDDITNTLPNHSLLYSTLHEPS